MKKSLSSLFVVIATSVSVPVTAEDYDSESLFSRNNAVMAVGAVDTINTVLNLAKCLQSFFKS
ncbi:hypothetical protein AB4254_12490 [Vibrio breoganii]